MDKPLGQCFSFKSAVLCSTSSHISSQYYSLFVILQIFYCFGFLFGNIWFGGVCSSKSTFFPLGSPKYYGLPNSGIHKTGVPLRPIISSRGSATYETAKDLAKILKPLVGRSPHQVHNNKDFLDSIKNIKIKREVQPKTTTTKLVKTTPSTKTYAWWSHINKG